MVKIQRILAGILCSVLFVGCSGGMADGCCGWSGKDTTATGQVKKVHHETPVFCPDYYEVDISLGVMRNGVGSMSTHDESFFIPDNMVSDMKVLAENSSIVNFNYDVKRSGWCVNDKRITAFKLTK